MAAKKTKTDKIKEAPKPEVAEIPKAATAKPAKKEADPKPKKTSALDAAAKVLGEAGQPMTGLEMIEDHVQERVLDLTGRGDPASNSLFCHIARNQDQGEGGPVPENRAGEVRRQRVDETSARFNHGAPRRGGLFSLMASLANPARRSRRGPTWAMRWRIEPPLYALKLV